jgi:hypothetical protein
VTICNPCPYDDTRFQWGDYHFAKSLKDALGEQGCSVNIRYWPEWSSSATADLLIVLRGNRRTPVIEGDYRVRSLWLISHPEDVEDSELEQFDYIFAASDRHAEDLAHRGHQAMALYQCTSDKVFFPRLRDARTMDNMFTFVGNTRGADRRVIREAVEAGLPLKLWGRGWDRAPYCHFLRGPVYDYAQLGHLYRHSFCVLNDHWPDMTDFHYVNNRVFDALACGVPVISDRNEAILRQFHFSGVFLVDEDLAFQDQVDDFLVHYDDLQEAAYADSLAIAEAHTFSQRASMLLERSFSGG